MPSGWFTANPPFGVSGKHLSVLRGGFSLFCCWAFLKVLIVPILGFLVFTAALNSRTIRPFAEVWCGFFLLQGKSRDHSCSVWSWSGGLWHMLVLVFTPLPSLLFSHGYHGALCFFLWCSHCLELSFTLQSNTEIRPWPRLDRTQWYSSTTLLHQGDTAPFYDTLKAWTDMIWASGRVVES